VAAQIIKAVLMFGSLFGGGDDKKINKDGELALYPSLLVSSDVKFSSLSKFIQKLSPLFEMDPKGMRLTTPMKDLPSNDSSGPDDEDFMPWHSMECTYHPPKH
jgi:hypothetical protein